MSGSARSNPPARDVINLRIPADQKALIDRAAAARAFDTPEAVLTQAGLSDAQKIEILRRWKFDATEIADAEGEGMESDKPLLERRVALALESLTDGNDVEPA